MQTILDFWWAPLLYVVFGFGLWCFTWLLYLAGMAIQWSASRLSPGSLTARLVVPVQYAAGYSSTALNWTVFTVLLLEWPKEAFLSTRLARHKRQGHGWRQRFADFLGRTWLDPFDPTGHHI